MAGGWSLSGWWACDWWLVAGGGSPHPQHSYRHTERRHGKRSHIFCTLAIGYNDMDKMEIYPHIFQIRSDGTSYFIFENKLHDPRMYF